MRLRSTMALFEEHLRDLDAGLASLDPATVGKDRGDPMSDAQRERLATLEVEIAKLATAAVTLEKDRPLAAAHKASFRRDDELTQVAPEDVSRESLDARNVPRTRPELRSVPKV